MRFTDKYGYKWEYKIIHSSRIEKNSYLYTPPESRLSGSVYEIGPLSILKHIAPQITIQSLKSIGHF